jgi:ATP:ADP antiporter, AAA family
VTGALTRLAMATASVMLAHLVAGKAFRDAAFLSAWPATALPLMTIATAVGVVLLVPLFSRLVGSLGPVWVVAAGFTLSAAGHAIEWSLYDAGRWVVVAIYLHLAATSGLLLSGFWSLVDERFDPAAARASFGRIAAAGTAGGVLGGIAAERMATMMEPAVVLLLLALLHLVCAVGSLGIGRFPALLSHRPESPASGARRVMATPYLRVIAGIVICTAAGSAILDYLIKSQASSALGTGPQLLRFFAGFYAVVQVLTFVAQTGMRPALARLGIGATIRTLPAAVGAGGLAALVAGGWPMIVLLRGLESVVRGSFFRNGYELLFVPMDPGDRRRVKTAIDVTCDRAGEAAGAGIVQVLLTVAAVVSGWLLAIVVMLAAASYWLGRRLDQLYLGVVEQELLKRRDAPPIAFSSEAGWTIVSFDKGPLVRSGAVPNVPSHVQPPDVLPPPIALLADLKSGSRTSVERALRRIRDHERMHVAAVIDLLAWDAVVPLARAALEACVPKHLGMLVDALLDPQTDFAIRRRLPRILGTAATERSLQGLVHALDDARFEVRYHCSRAIDRILARNPDLAVDPVRMLAVVERELSVSTQVWQGYRLLDRPDTDGSPDMSDAPPGLGQRNVEHVFLLLATFIPREPLDAAMRGIASPNAGVRGLAAEYLGQVLAPGVLAKLQVLIEASGGAGPDNAQVTPSSGDAPARSDPPPRANQS